MEKVQRPKLINKMLNSVKRRNFKCHAFQKTWLCKLKTPKNAQGKTIKINR